jgi:cob(I)alamin adenosyltransferase
VKIYTRSGDHGDTGLFGGGTIRKSSLRVETYGTVDELNSILGVVRALEIPDQAGQWLNSIQADLFNLGADLATPVSVKSEWVVRMSADRAQMLERGIDEMDTVLPPLKHFILPGGTLASAHLHVARAVCRRAERAAVALADTDEVNAEAIIYLNRLSDFLFTLARWVNYSAGTSETAWDPHIES